MNKIQAYVTPSSSDGLQPTSDGLQPNSDGLHDNFDVFQPTRTSVGVQPIIDALQPTSDVQLYNKTQALTPSTSKWPPT